MIGAGLARARAFVEAQGDALARGRIQALLDARAVEAVIASLGTRQAPDGSFPPLGKDASGRPGLVGTLQVLVILGDLRRLEGPLAEEAVGYLTSVQNDDGSWAVTARDDQPARLVLTAMLAGFLARTDFVRPRVLDAAGTFLEARWSREAVADGDYGRLAAFTHFFSNVPHELSDQALQWCGRALERAYRSRRLDALRTARIFTLCDAQALPGARVDARELVPALLACQGGDGGWEAGVPAVEHRVEATLEAALALVRLCGTGC